MEASPQRRSRDTAVLSQLHPDEERKLKALLTYPNGVSIVKIPLMMGGSVSMVTHS